MGIPMTDLQEEWFLLLQPELQHILFRMSRAAYEVGLKHAMMIELFEFVQLLHPQQSAPSIIEKIVQGAWLEDYKSVQMLSASPKIQSHRKKHAEVYTKWLKQLALLPNTPRHRADLELAQAHHIRAVPWFSLPYPATLKQSPLTPPGILFVSSEYYLNVLDTRTLSIVGSRKMTDYGRRFLELELPRVLTHPLVTVSGMARGIDSVVHEVTLQEKQPTIAVLAHGLDQCYPSEHRTLKEGIRRSGALMSEYLPGTQVHKQAFAARNRIIAGLGHATLVVEADSRSGALITANQALNSHREVLAVPGSVYALMSRGCLDLIAQGATLVRHSGDILSSLYSKESLSEMDEPIEEAMSAKVSPLLEEDQKTLLDLLKHEPLTTDQIASRLQWDIVQTMLKVSKLELMAILYQDQGRYFLTSYGYSCI